MHRSHRAALLVAAGVLLTTWVGGAPVPGPGPDVAEQRERERERVSDQRFPDVVDAGLVPSGAAFQLTATLSSPYDTEERYADAFRALTPDGQVLGVRELLHDHADEQPFTRTMEGLDIPDDVDEIVVEGRDLEHGWGGATVTVEVPR